MISRKNKNKEKEKKKSQKPLMLLIYPCTEEEKCHNLDNEMTLGKMNNVTEVTCLATYLTIF